ncbi:hypothetical protein ASF93_03635 [Microbacterium sp. Leaf347]|jgi:alpha-1,2-mannosyltransferase|nr:hypothetical protein ASF93_03635 [Microbacterium sp. Leaf347]KQR97124.1 hypothetical protein ASG00_12705 [Microbacterium sp. Leaf351]ODU49956.1 MAG: hypothetical protein ABT07_03875 [Microbacterium sp. SCN 70-10]OJU78242.1 MAG: hypothetical protein BGO15_03405 [Microbacterium sp. 71-23]
MAAVALAAAACTWITITWITQVNPVDFLVYRYGAQLMLAGGDPYAGNLQGPMMPEGGMPFTYTPFAVLSLVPTVLFDTRTAYVLWSIASMAVVAWAVWRFAPERWHGRPVVMTSLVVAAASTTMVTQHLSFGQINLPLMALVLWDLTRSDSRGAGRVPVGLFVGVAAAIKLTPGLFIAHLLVTRQWRRAGWALVGFLSATALAFALLPAVSARFWTSVIWQLSSRVDFTGGGFASYGNNSVPGVLAAAGAAPVVGSAVAAVVALGGLMLAARAYRRGAAIEAVLIVGLVAPMVSPISWIHHWVYILPAAVVVLSRAGVRTRVVALAVGLPVLAAGPGLGEFLLSALWPFWPWAAALRECLLLTSIVLVIALARAGSVRPMVRGAGSVPVPAALH